MLVGKGSSLPSRPGPPGTPASAPDAAACDSVTLTLAGSGGATTRSSARYGFQVIPMLILS